MECEVARKIKLEWVNEIKRRNLQGTELEVKEVLKKLLVGEPIEELCLYAREFGKLVWLKKEARERSRIAK